VAVDSGQLEQVENVFSPKEILLKGVDFKKCLKAHIWRGR
jgi:hypothetical protein